ncbi:MAG: class I SAM-dependent methyltransferase [Candidatus Korarchaeota archaeon]|nr:class I SAM-dependent methyltransferase [Candidatus Korarchaeota archaeon]
MPSRKFKLDYNEEYYRDMKAYPKKHMAKFILHKLGALKSPESVKWLDIGCGTGSMIKELLDLGIDAYGIEISRAAIEMAPTKVKSRIVEASILKIPFIDSEFHVVSAIDVVEHVHPRDIFQAISEICRIMRPSGYLILTTANPCKASRWLYDLTHINVRPLRFWKDLLEDSCFKVKSKYIPSDIVSYFKSLSSLSITPILTIGEPIRYLLGWYYHHVKGRLYLLAEKIDE